MRKLEKKICKGCGKEFEGDVRRKFCGRGCRNRFYVQADMAEARIEKVCVHCSQSFLAFRRNARYCSRLCMDQAAWKRRKQREGYHTFPEQRVWYEKRKVVLAKSKGLCWLCEKPIEGRFQVHHLDFGDHSVHSERLVPLHDRCHNLIHHVTVCVSAAGEISFHGTAVDLIRQRV